VVPSFLLLADSNLVQSSRWLHLVFSITPQTSVYKETVIVFHMRLAAEKLPPEFRLKNGHTFDATGIISICEDHLIYEEGNDDEEEEESSDDDFQTSLHWTSSSGVPKHSGDPGSIPDGNVERNRIQTFDIVRTTNA
ncbi:hypothetical protein L9F63_008105, partial [Diploptera punctata]